MKPLHKNTGKYNRDTLLFNRLFLHFNIAEDPDRPLWRRTWAVDIDGLRSEFLLSLKITYDDAGQKLYLLYIGPFCFGASWV